MSLQIPAHRALEPRTLERVLREIGGNINRLWDALRALNPGQIGPDDRVFPSGGGGGTVAAPERPRLLNINSATDTDATLLPHLWYGITAEGIRRAINTTTTVYPEFLVTRSVGPGEEYEPYGIVLLNMRMIPSEEASVVFPAARDSRRVWLSGSSSYPGYLTLTRPTIPSQGIFIGHLMGRPVNGLVPVAFDPTKKT